MAMFTASASIKKAVSLINELDVTKFPLLLSRIMQKLHVKEERTFSEEEEEKLQNAFEISPSDLELILQTLEFILQQAAYHTAKPTTLGEQLKDLQLDDDKVSIIVEAWTTGARDLVQKLRDRTVHPLQLEDINWRINLQMAQTTLSKMKLPNALFQLGIRNDTTGLKENIRVEFTHEELYEFYNQLEVIQSQLDSLS
ncbi:COMM domain-containing protein 10 [Biomphalaria glabrata]|uniref:COMM domain-containing protein 10-like n=1 Tax=Biomphalaria glabrata TaxID=6526 RepID=A0A9W2ZH15_BIOGL|nr:COMM domain-containing protein 10-like [Biomphalaria glabrata]KAI8768170.1 COMM domain-containing protein 10 [Biomphalaria glabrata]